MKLVPIIGLEIHVELATKSKMFCGCSNGPDTAEPNTLVCPVCLAHPGTLPVPNRAAIASVVKIGRAIGAHVRELSKFDRKHYFYPDLPKGYQISQYDEPIAEHGNLELNFLPGDNARSKVVIGITRAHLEEDTAKLLHDSAGTTYVNFNRSGAPLVEIVTDPDFQSAAEAKKFGQELQLLLRYLGVSNADMEKGQMRVEANISVQAEGKFSIENGVVIPAPGATLNNKVEVKNINSFRAVEKAIQFEIARQTKMIEAGESWPQQTRGWDDNKGETVMQRIKENAADYRYFPEPDIPPFHPLAIAGEIRLPELPTATRARLRDEYGFSYADAEFLATDRALTNFADQVMSELLEWFRSLPETKDAGEAAVTEKKSALARLAGGWITSKLLGILNERSETIKDLKISAENFAELLTLISAGRVNSTNGLKILSEMVAAGTDIDPTHLMESKGYGQKSDAGELNAIIADVIKRYPAQVAQFKAGKEPVLQFLKGMVMKATEGSADPAVAEQLLREQLR